MRRDLGLGLGAGEAASPVHASGTEAEGATSSNPLAVADLMDVMEPVEPVEPVIKREGASAADCMRARARVCVCVCACVCECTCIRCPFRPVAPILHVSDHYTDTSFP